MIEKKPIPAVIIGGPTASGKSALALKIAQDLKGEIINADSMQVYNHLPILTACPPLEDYDRIPHHLYGVLSGSNRGSVGWWYEEACYCIQEVHHRGKTPVIVGGTGLYLKALTHGISPIPAIQSDIRQRVVEMMETLSRQDFHDYVTFQDPKIRGKFAVNDAQRLSRALEVFLQTGQSIIDFQGKAEKKLSLDYRYYVLIPNRDVLKQRINSRLETMIQQGALTEVQQLISLGLPPSFPIMKAVGAPELTAYLTGTLTLEEAITQAQQSTQQYAKRQVTWFRHQSPENAEYLTIPPM
jgi:tRNA dimethylallyltransferase